MKKTLTLIAAMTLGAMSFSSWADKLTVGASNVPHAEILEQAKPDSRKTRYRSGDQNRSRITFCRTPRWLAVKSTPTTSSTFRT